MVDIMEFASKKRELSGEEKSEELKNRGFLLDDKTRVVKYFNANFFARFISNNIYLKYTKDNCFYTFRGIVWEKLEEVDVKMNLRNILQMPRFGVWTVNREKEYLEALKLEVYYPKEMNANKNLINLTNGTFNIEDYQMYIHHYSYYSTIMIPVEYNPNASCPNFLKFLNDVFEGDAERIAILQEWFGYSMTTETKAQKSLILSGAGGNGKGVIIHLLSMLLGEENISTIPLNELHKGFSRVCLYNKLANISSENESDGKAFNTQYFKAIVGEDSIPAEQKGKPVFTFKAKTKMIQSMNNLPRTIDKSDGFYRRLSILRFNKSFHGENRDNNLKEKLEKEISGIFLWAIDGLKRLRENDYNFSKCTDMEQALEEYKSEQNPMIEFFKECIEEETESENRVDNKIVYQTFRSWAAKNGHNKLSGISTIKFWKEFESHASSLGYNIGKGRSNSFRYHTGIKLVREYKVNEEFSQFQTLNKEGEINF
jgi:putative DNA primase/helicase